MALKGTFHEFEEAAYELNLKVNEDKTVYMKTSRKNKEENFKVTFRDHSYSSVNQFKYLGSLATDDNKVESEIEARIAAENRCYFSLEKILNFRALSKRIRVVIYKTIVRPVVIFGEETWPLTRKPEQMLNSWEKKVLRRIWEGVLENGV
ncbi:uncharacterized protein [Halyomorpha halys]|uniref:uncharacterized protein n=1 Tax=Halyomorpha halys TaxID=286706 RepID=UPI0034D37A1F